MGQERQLAHAYRERAEELRIIAEADKSTSASESLVKAAQSYERLAENLDAIAARNDESPAAKIQAETRSDPSHT